MSLSVKASSDSVADAATATSSSEPNESSDGVTNTPPADSIPPFPQVQVSEQPWGLVVGVNGNYAYWAIKRVIDIIGAIFALIILAPLFALVAIAIKLDSPGPVFFVQSRMGAHPLHNLRKKDGPLYWEVRSFPMYKFRSMRADADESLHIQRIKEYAADINAEDPDGELHTKLIDDPRITRVGKIIRKTSIDELPQLINVLRGEMSLIGPRPVPNYERYQYEPWHRDRLATLPGLTGLYQVLGRGRMSFDEGIELDLKYISEQNLWLDIKIVALTIPAILSGKGAG